MSLSEILLHMEPTRPTLLNRLRAGGDAVAWEEVYRQYEGVILRYARKLNLNETQAFDVLQETMIELMRVLPNFEYNPRRGKFRNFLLTIVHRRVLRVFRRQRRRGEIPLETDAAERPWEERLAGPAPQDELAEQDENRWRHSVVEECLERIRVERKLDDKTLAIFTAFALEGQTAAAVAEKYGSTANNVYQTKLRILKWLQTEVAMLLDNETEAER